MRSHLAVRTRVSPRAPAILIKGAFVGAPMAKKTQGPGIQSAAGLIRYFDAEETSSVKIAPSYVLILSAVVGIGVILMHILWEF